MELRPRIGSIYLMTCKRTGKHYVGQTIQNVQKRVSQHFYNAFDTKPGRRGCPKLDSAIKKYGRADFTWKVLETTESLFDRLLYKKLDALEEKYIKLYNSFQNGYNCTSGGQQKRLEYSPEVIEKFRLGSLGRKQSKETVNKRMETFKERDVFGKIKRKVAQLDMNGNFIKEWSSISEAAYAIGGSRNSHISDVCQGKRTHWHNYKWKYNF